MSPPEDVHLTEGIRQDSLSGAHSHDRMQLARALPSLVVASNPMESIRRPLPQDVIQSLDILWPSEASIADFFVSTKPSGWRADGDLMRLDIESSGFERHLRIDPDQVLLHGQSSEEYQTRQDPDKSYREDHHFVLITPRVAVSIFLSVDDYCDEHFDGKLTAQIVISDDAEKMQAHVRRELARFSHQITDEESLLKNIYAERYVEPVKPMSVRPV